MISANELRQEAKMKEKQFQAKCMLKRPDMRKKTNHSQITRSSYRNK